MPTDIPLGHHKLRSVDLHQRLTAPHGLAGRVDVELVDPALELGVHDVKTPLVGLDGADGTNRAVEQPPLDWRGLDSEFLHFG